MPVLRTELICRAPDPRFAVASDGLRTLHRFRQPICDQIGAIGVKFGSQPQKIPLIEAAALPNDTKDRSFMPTQLDPADRAKFAAAERALAFVEDGMRLGLGTGSTAAWFVRLLGERIKNDGLDVTCVPTSSRTRDLARSVGIPITTLDEIGWLDLTVDGADEFDPNLNLIKGGGGALLQEKIVATASDQMMVISDDTKQVAHLGAFPLPVEVVKFGWETTKAIIEDTLSETEVAGQKVTIRLSQKKPYITDEGHYILDLHLHKIGSPKVLGLLLNQIPGVVEHGLFIDVADAVCIGYASGEARVLQPDLDMAEA